MKRASFILGLLISFALQSQNNYEKRDYLISKVSKTYFAYEKADSIYSVLESELPEDSLVLMNRAELNYDKGIKIIGNDDIKVIPSRIETAKRLYGKLAVLYPKSAMKLREYVMDFYLLSVDSSAKEVRLLKYQELKKNFEQQLATVSVTDENRRIYWFVKKELVKECDQNILKLKYD